MKKFHIGLLALLSLCGCSGGSSDSITFNRLNLGSYSGYLSYQVLNELETGYCGSQVVGHLNIQGNSFDSITLEQGSDNQLNLRRLYHDGIYAGLSIAVLSGAESQVSTTETITLLRDLQFPESTGCDGTLDTVFEALSGSRIGVNATLHLLCLDGRGTHSCEISEQAELEHDDAR